VWLAAPHPQALPIDLQHDDQEECKSANPRLGPKTSRCTLVLRPRNLEVTDNESARHASKIEPGGHLTRSFWVGIQIVGGYRRSRDHDSKHIKTPAQRCEHVMVAVFEGEAEENQAST